jgi:hypothetical protein
MRKNLSLFSFLVAFALLFSNTANVHPESLKILHDNVAKFISETDQGAATTLPSEN